MAYNRNSRLSKDNLAKSQGHPRERWPHQAGVEGTTHSKRNYPSSPHRLRDPHGKDKGLILSTNYDLFIGVDISYLGASFLAGSTTLTVLLSLMWSNYLFKLTVALLDTPFLYLGVYYLKSYLQLSAEEVLGHAG